MTSRRRNGNRLELLFKRSQIWGHLMAFPSGNRTVHSPLRIRAARIKRGRPLTSAIILATYSPTKPTAKILNEPNIRVVISNVVTPRGAISGTNIRSPATTMAANVESANVTTPMTVSMVSGVLLKEKIPFFAQSKFLIRLLVVTPNMRFGRT